MIRLKIIKERYICWQCNNKKYLIHFITSNSIINDVVYFNNVFTIGINSNKWDETFHGKNI